MLTAQEIRTKLEQAEGYIGIAAKMRPSRGRIEVLDLAYNLLWESRRMIDSPFWGSPRTESDVAELEKLEAKIRHAFAFHHSWALGAL